MTSAQDISRLPAVRNQISVPATFANAGEKATTRLLEFFTAAIRNPNTRAAYARAVSRFDAWCQENGLSLSDLTPFHIAGYVESLGRTHSKPSVKQHLAALRMLFDYLVVGQVIPSNPAAAVRGPKFSARRGKTPILTAEETRQLIDSIEADTVIGLRDRALISLMAFSFARVGAALGMNGEDFFQQGRRSWVRLHEKGGIDHDVPVHHTLDEYLDAYLHAAPAAKAVPIFRSVDRKGRLSNDRLERREALAMIKRRALAAGLDAKTCCHTFRATGITNYLQNGGTLERAQQIAAHQSSTTTKLYDRTSDEITLDEIERIRF